ncbi:MAG: HEAT repeat domain-containing protein [Planctomycetota bacterium]
MKRWAWVPLIPVAFLLSVCVSQPGVTDEGGGGKPSEGAERSAARDRGPLDLPWEPKAIADAIQDLSDPEWPTRVAAIRKVVGADRWIVPFLLVALKNPEPLNRQEVAYCLGRIGDPVAVDSLIEVLEEEPEFDVIVHAADALGRIGDPAAVDALKPLLKYFLEKEEYGREVGPFEVKTLESKEGTVRHAAAEALCRLGDNSGVDVLIEGLTKNGWLRRDAAVRLRQLTGGKVDFGFFLDMKKDELDKVQAKWAEWWKANEAGFKPVVKPHRNALDVYMDREK